MHQVIYHKYVLPLHNQDEVGEGGEGTVEGGREVHNLDKVDSIHDVRTGGGGARGYRRPKREQR